MEVHRTEVIEDARDPEWKPFLLPLGVLTGADAYRSTLLFQCFDQDSFGKYDFIGSAVVALIFIEKFDKLQITFPELFTAKRLELMNDQKKKPGSLELVSCELAKAHHKDRKKSDETSPDVNRIMQKLRQGDTLK